MSASQIALLTESLAACPNGEDAARSLLWVMWNRPWYREHIRHVITPVDGVGGEFGPAHKDQQPRAFTTTGNPLRLVGGAA